MYSTLITSGCFTVKAMSSEPAWLKGTQSAMGPRWPGHLSVWKAFTSTRNQIYLLDTSTNALQFCSVFNSILDLLMKTSFTANSSNSSCHIILSYLVKNCIQRNMNRRGEKRVGAVRETSPSFAKITRERISNIGEQIIVIYIWKIDGKGYIYLENQAFSPLNLRQWFRLLAISHLYWCLNSEVFVDVWIPWKSIGEFSMVHKKMSADMA